MSMIKKILKRLYLSAAAGLSRDDSAKIVFYHDVGRANTPMGTDAALFAAHVREAKRRGWSFAPAPGPFLERPAEKSLLLCFDDGFRGVWENRAFFREEGLRPLVFLAVRLVGQPGYLTWDEIIRLRDEFGFRFGGHTWSHQTLAGEMIDESPKEARTDAWFARELFESREFLSRRLGESVDSLCFPVGHFSADVIRRCAEAGYRWLFTSVPGRIPLAVQGAGSASDAGDVVLLPRVLCQDLSTPEFASVLRGGMSRLSGRYLRQHFSPGRGASPMRPQEILQMPQPEDESRRNVVSGSVPATERIVVVAVEPADYTIDLIRNVYQPRGADWCFLKNSSLASDACGSGTGKLVVGELPILQMVAAAVRLLKRNDVLILNGWTQRFNVLVAVLNLVFFRKTMVWESDTPLRIPENRLARLAKALWLRSLFRRRFCWGFAGGNYSHKDLFRHYGMDEHRIVLAPMVVDSERIARFRSTADRGAHPFRFVYLGRLVGLKCVDSIVRAFQGLPMDAELHIVGDGPERENLRQLADGNPRVVFHGAVFGDAKLSLLASMSCLVLFSRTEPWGLVVNEAFSMGIPCIVSDAVGAHRDLIDGAETGLVVPSGDEDALRAAMGRVASDRDSYARMSACAIDRMKTWTYREYAQNLDEFLAVIRKGGEKK